MFQRYLHIGRVLLAAVLLCQTISATADVLMHDIVLSDESQLITNSTAVLKPISIQFSAMGRDLLLKLEPSRFNRQLEQYGNAKHSLPKLYQGTIAGDPNSWARVSLQAHTITGYIYHFGTLLQLESRTYANANFGTNDTATTGTDFVLIEPFNHADAAPLVDGLFGSTDKLIFAPNYTLSDKPEFQYDKNTQSALTHRDATDTSVTRAIRIGVVIDSRFDEVHKYRGLARALSIINSIDAIFQSQLGMAIIVEAIRVYDDPDTDPMRNNGESIKEVLENFRSVRMADEQLPNDLTLVHLFSGFRDPNRMIGLGWISTACRLDGYDISLSTSFPFDTLLAAHEMAHNLGALHDDEPQCLADPNRQANTIMWPEITGSSGSTFSACSTRAMQSAKFASCNIDNIDVSVRLRTYPTNEALRRSVVIEVKNKDKHGRATELVSTTEFPVGTQLSDVSAGCSVTDSTVECDHGTIQPGSNQLASVTAALLSVSQESAISEVEVVNASDTKNRDNRVAIQLLQFDTTTGDAIAASSPLMVLNDDAGITTPNPPTQHSGNLSIVLLVLLQLALIRRRRR